jgi:glyoxylase-like metal-dependent hydrolase (beta-lactamase superfamily II)
VSESQQQLHIGDIKVTVISAGHVRMDGGAMFGVVPKGLWSRRIAPDDRNRIDLQMWCLLVETQQETLLIETGFGGKVSERLREIFDLRESPGLMDGLAAAGKQPEEIDTVILTHLHQDHAGGTTRSTGSGYELAFPNARHIVQAGEWHDATEADGQTVNAYRSEEVLVPLERSGKLDLVDGDSDLGNGIQLILTPGHTRAHQSVLIQDSGQSLFYVGDLVPTASHLKPIYVMAYDLYPRETYFNKGRFLERAAEDDWWVVWPHDPRFIRGKIQTDEREGYIAVETVLSREE